MENIREEVNTFIFAGHDTTVATLSWTLYLIRLYPDIQNRLYNELSSIVAKDEDITTDQIKQMSFLEAVLMESMRLYPPVHMIARKVTHEMRLAKYTIPCGAIVHLSIANLMTDQNVYPSSSVFNPDRFLGEKSIKNENPFSFVPFSAGPRNCIGGKLALNELKIILSKVLINFRFESVVKREDLNIIYGMVVKPMDGIQMKVSPR